MRGGASWYYGDLYVRLGVDREPFPPRAGDTLLHLALRYKRSPAFIATLLQLGADKKIKNNPGIEADAVDPHLFQKAEALLESWKEEQGQKMYAVGAQRRR